MAVLKYSFLLLCRRTTPAYEIAAGLWPLLFASAPASMFTSDSAFSPTNPSQQQEYMEAWLEFLKTVKGGKTVSKDVWTLVRCSWDWAAVLVYTLSCVWLI